MHAISPPETTQRNASASFGRTKRADLLSAVGAGVLGAGLSLIFADALKPYATIILVVGLVAHSWGMFTKHVLEKQALPARLWWAEIIYWLCWLALAVLIVVIARRKL